MELVQNNMMEIIAVSQNLLINCVNNETPIGIHIHEKDSLIRNSMIVREFSLKINELYVAGDWFELSVDEVIIDIQYIEEDDSIYILFKDKEIYLDLC